MKELETSEKFDKAMALIEKTRNSELAKMIELFDEAKTVIQERRRELAMVIEIRSKKIAMAVDAVESIEQLNPEVNEKMRITQSGIEDGIVDKISQRTKDDTMVVVLGPRKKIIKHLTCLLARLPRYMLRHISRYAQAHVPCRRTKIRRNLV